jgi:hypothetical protein
MCSLLRARARVDAFHRAIGITGVWQFATEFATSSINTLSTPLPAQEHLHRFELGATRVTVAPLTQADIRRLFVLLNEELRNSATQGELFLVGGAVMCLAYAARPATQDVDAVFRPATEVREAAARVAARARLRQDWLNDGVKGFMSAQGDFASFLELDHLRVMVAQPAYLLAMKCLAMRIGAEFHDEDDVRYLLRHLDIRGYEAALAVIGKYFPIERFPQKSLYALGELLPTAGE